MVRERITTFKRIVMLEPRPEGGEGASHVIYLGKSGPG